MEYSGSSAVPMPFTHEQHLRLKAIALQLLAELAGLRNLSPKMQAEYDARRQEILGL